MNKPLLLSVLDQSPIHDDCPDSSGLYSTIELSKLCEQWGYHRYWLAEHHDTPGYASPSPEIMVSQVAQATNKIRVGSGGVMLPHYSAFKVAETFKMLEAFNPGRIDLGIGRAPGGNPLFSEAISAPRRTIPPEYYPQQASDLIGYLTGNLPDNHPYKKAAIYPRDIGSPDIWMLGSSDGSAELAGELGAGFVLALFIGTHERPIEIVSRYCNAFVPNATFEEPHPMLAVATICAESKEEAEWIASSHTYWKVQAFRHGRRDGLLAPNKALDAKKKLSLSDQAYFDETLASMTLGTADNCYTELNEIATRYGVTEMMVVNVTHHFADRKKSYELLAQAAGLSDGNLNLNEQNKE